MSCFVNCLYSVRQKIGLGAIGGGHNDDEQNKLTMELKWIEQKLMGANNDLLFTDPNKVNLCFQQNFAI